MLLLLLSIVKCFFINDKYMLELKIIKKTIFKYFYD